MKAAVLEQFGAPPKHRDWPDPKIQNKDHVILEVKAAAVKNLDKLRANGTHYASHRELPAVVGMDGVGLLEDGTGVYAKGITGMIAEKALVHKSNFTLIPENLDFGTAAALPNAVLGAAMPLEVKGKIKPDQNVCINGATGVTGQVAVQLAKYYGAKKIIATGRNQQLLEKTRNLGADITVSLDQADEAILEQFHRIHLDYPLDIVVDYLWGTPIELIMKAVGGYGLNNFTHQTKIISVGSMAGEDISLASETLRSTAIQIVGSGFGSLSQEDFDRYDRKILPEMFRLAADGKLHIEIAEGPLEDIESLWDRQVGSGKRLVITMP